MSKIKTGIPQGTRDFAADVIRKREYIINTIRQVFELYGFEPLETPAMENLSTLMGKYGEEGDKLLFKVLNNGLNHASKQQQAKADFDKILAGKNVVGITERALRYDLTIPFARYVAMNHGQLTFPYKRYQIQPVWRADRPQRGRYREFFQCDADVVGSNSLLNEVELACIYNEVFQRLGIQVQIKLNNRKILSALAQLAGGADMMMTITVAIDKLDKIGWTGVKKELFERGLNESQVAQIEKYLSIEGSNAEKLSQLKALFQGNESGEKGIAEIEFVFDYLAGSGISQLEVDLTLARGLNYYTGIIFEIKAKAVQIGSIGGGGRYDDLTGLFGVPNIPGVGISFGVDRIYDVMEELQLFPEQVQTGTQVLFFNLGAQESRAAFHHMQLLRKKGIRCEIYPQQVKLDKQFKYAGKKLISFVIIIGSEELAENTCVIKDLKTAEQKTVKLDELLDFNF